MSTPILATKLYIPPPRPKVIARPHLTRRLNEALQHRLTLISAPAGFGKTSLISEWVANWKYPVAWLSLDEADNNPTRFLIHLIAAVQRIETNTGAAAIAALESAQPPPTESILTTLLNEIMTLADDFVIILDDYHVIESETVDDALTFLLEHLPAQMHLVIATREDPHLPLARLRVRGQLLELRAADLRFAPIEAAEFLNQVMQLNLSAQEIIALETRTEGWIAGLQLAAISLQGHEDVAAFIQSFTGSHHFVLDYLVEEVLGQQSERIQAFLARTSILDRMCGPLCDAVLRTPTASGQETLTYLEHANLFVVPLDNERRWYRYHHLFAELLRQRLPQSDDVDELHRRASQWYENNGLEIEAFHHAAAANDIERAERFITRGAMPLHSLAVVNAVLSWLDSLSETVLTARPWLRIRSAMSMLMAGQTTGVEEKLQAAENSLQSANLDPKTRDLIGQIAAIRATLAIVRYQPEETILQARYALEHLQPDNVSFCSRAMWALGFAHQIQGDRKAARQFYVDAIRYAAGNTYYTVLSTASLAKLEESENQLHQAAALYRRSLQLLSDQGPPNASEEYIGLARILYEWNDLDAAEQYAQQSLHLARQYDPTVDRYIGCEVLLARLKLARGDDVGASLTLAETALSVRRHHFVQRTTEVAAVQVLTLLRQGDVAAAARLVQIHNLPVSQARVFLAQGHTAEALAVLSSLRQHAEAKGWQDERLKLMVLQAVALHVHGEKDKAVQVLEEALMLAEPGGCIRLFMDEGLPMAQLLAEAAERRIMPDYIGKLLAAFESVIKDKGQTAEPSALVDPLSQRELEILKLITQGLSNREIGERLFLALDTVKGHNRRIFDKLQVQRRTEAIARARELGLL